MGVRFVSSLVALAATTLCLANEKPILRVDHVWLAVTLGAPERAALEKAGFHISPNVNHHEGSGTSSVTVEFENTYIELMYVDPAVSMAPESARAVEKSKLRAAWQTSGWCPIGIGMHRIGESNDPLPLPIWTISPVWLQPDKMEILTPKDDTKSPSLFVVPQKISVDEAANRKAAAPGSPRAAEFNHPAKARRLTSVQIVSPKAYEPIEALKYLQKQGVVSVKSGETWCLELTFDNGKQKKAKDLRPDLPLILRM